MANTARKLDVSSDTQGTADAAPQRTLFVLERETAKLEKFRLEEILARYNEIEEPAPDSEPTLQVSAEAMHLARLTAKSAEEEDTIDAPSPRIPAGIPSPLGDDAPEPTSTRPVSAYNRKFSPVPDLPLVTTPATSKSRPFIAAVAPAGTAAALAGSGIRASGTATTPNEARTRWVVVGIWASAVALAAGLAIMAAHEEKTTSHPTPAAGVATE